MPGIRWRARQTFIDRLVLPRRQLPGNSGAVALTFDDGPHPEATPAVLDILAHYQVRSTFFMVGERARELPHLVQAVRRAGHVIGSHSRTHPDPWAVSAGTLYRDYRDGQRMVERAVGAPVTLFRPPKGYLDAAAAVTIRRLRLRTWLWTVDPHDWQPGVKSEQLLERTAAVQAGAVVLLHDGLERPLDDRALDRSATLAALPLMIEGIRARGLSLVPCG